MPRRGIRRAACFCIAKHTAGNSASGKLHSCRRNVGLSLTPSKGLKLNDEVNVRFPWDFEMQCARARARTGEVLLVVSSRSRYFFSSFLPFFSYLISWLAFLSLLSIPGVFSLDKFAAVGNKTRLLFISVLPPERNGKMCLTEHNAVRYEIAGFFFFETKCQFVRMKFQRSIVTDGVTNVS